MRVLPSGVCRRKPPPVYPRREMFRSSVLKVRSKLILWPMVPAPKVPKAPKQGTSMHPSRHPGGPEARLNDVKHGCDPILLLQGTEART